MSHHIHRTEVANCNFILVGIEGDFGAQIGTVDDTDMLLWRTNVAGILERDPRMPRLKQH